MEQAVIRGARETLARHRPVLYVENDRAAHARALVRQLEALGYRLYWHLPPYFNPGNYAKNPVNVFGNIASRNMPCIPAEREREGQHGGFGLAVVDDSTLPPPGALNED